MEHLDSTVNPPVVSVVSEMSAVVRSLLDTRVVQLCLWRFLQLVVSGHSQFNCCCPDWPETAFQGFPMDVTDVFFKKPSCEKNLELPHHWRFKGNAAETLLKGGAIPQCIPPHRGREAPHHLTIFEMQCPPGRFFWHQCSVLPTSKLAQTRFLLDMIWWCSKWYIHQHMQCIHTVFICMYTYTPVELTLLLCPVWW